MTTTDYNFAFKLPTENRDPENYAKQYFIDYVRKNHPTLTIIGLENNKSGDDINGFGIQYAEQEAVVEVAKNRYDIDWFPTEFDAAINGVRTELNLIDDWYEITGKLATYERQYNKYKGIGGSFLTLDSYNIKQNKVKHHVLSDGTKIDIYPAFIKVGLEIIPRNVKKEEVRFSKNMKKNYNKRVLEEIITIIIK